MAHAAFHLAEEFITEDLDYYFSGERDKNDQIRPDDNISSTTPYSLNLSAGLNDGEVSNFFYPTLPNLLDRVYIGISVPLFANNWGASFLLQLLKVIKPGGAIILPVYPEGQAQEKGYWSRSFLENVFLSRQRWTGFSNVRAENDGVMSLQVGRKWPDPIPSSVEWFYQQRSNLALAELLSSGSAGGLSSSYAAHTKNFWANYTHSAVIERIILDVYGAKTPVTVQCVGKDYGPLITDLLLSPYITVSNGFTIDTSSQQELVSANFDSYFSPYVKDRHQLRKVSVHDVEIENRSDVVCLLHAMSELTQAQQIQLVDKAWQKLNPKGCLIVHDEMQAGWQNEGASALHAKLESLGKISTYSSIVAEKIQQDVEISHYSSIQEAKLRDEKLQQTRVFKVIEKTA